MAIIAAFLCLALTGCDPVKQSSLKQPASALGVTEALPTSIAGPRMTLPLRQSVPSIPLQYALHVGQEVQLFSRGTWHGRVVVVYFLPASNLVLHGHQYELKSARGVQKVAQTRIRSEGTWSTVWRIGNYGMPRHQPFFLLARDSQGELGLIQVNTKN